MLERLLEIVLFIGSVGVAFWLGRIFRPIRAGTIYHGKKPMWGVWKMECRICTKKFVMVAPTNIDCVYNCECPNCGNMSAEPEKNCEKEGA